MDLRFPRIITSRPVFLPDISFDRSPLLLAGKAAGGFRSRSRDPGRSRRNRGSNFLLVDRGPGSPHHAWLIRANRSIVPVALKQASLDSVHEKNVRHGHIFGVASLASPTCPRGASSGAPAHVSLTATD